jgi:hypothetical protein
MIPCPKCGNDFPELRKTKFGYNFCVNCSTVERVVGITTVEGSGDHTYNDIIIMDKQTAYNIAKHEAEIMGRKILNDYELLDMDKDENEVSQSIKEKVNQVLDEDEEVTATTQQPEDDDEDRDGLIEGIDY